MPPTPKPKTRTHEGNGQAPSPVHEEKKSGGKGREHSEKPSQDRRDRRVSRSTTGVLEETEAFLQTYMVLTNSATLVVALWVICAWIFQTFDRFPHLAITSPEKRCGKTRFLTLLSYICRDAMNSANVSPAILYRLITQRRPTLLLDEAQSLKRRGSESSEVIRELLNAGIDKHSVVYRMGGKGYKEVEELNLFSPKVIALIGDLDDVLSDRCLPIRLERKKSTETVEKARSRLVRPVGKHLAETIEQWCEENGDKVSEIYDEIEPFNIENDRLAELLEPLQSVLSVADGSRLGELQEYAETLGQCVEKQSPKIQLLAACRNIFRERRAKHIDTEDLLSELVKRPEDPWATWSGGEPMTARALAHLLQSFNIKPEKNRQQKARGYFRIRFTDAWARYL